MKYQGKRIAQIVRLKKEHVEEYKKCHKEVWPEVLKQIKECCIEDCMYFLFHFPLLSHTVLESYCWIRANGRDDDRFDIL